MTETRAIVLALALVGNEDDRCIEITIKNKERMTYYGFGYFLENVKPGEVSATQEAIDALLAQPERMGLQGMEFWSDNRLAFCAQEVPLNCISVPSGARSWIKKFTVEETT